MDQFVIALGMFDGVHLGHAELIRTAADEAEKNGDLSVVFTYKNHPKELFSGSFEYVSTLSQRELFFRQLGADRIDIVAFTRKLSELTPLAFAEYLLSRYNHRISTVVCGYDYRFGKNAEGDANVLKKLGLEYGFQVHVVDPVLYNGTPCSSTRVRTAIREGNLAEAGSMLGRPYILSGRVVHHRSIGRQIGYPTANIVPGCQIIPKDGVYATALISDHKIFPSVTNIGFNPTVGGTVRSIETHVLNAGLDLYGREISILFFERIRDEECFASVDELSVQIGKDAESAHKIYRQNEKSVYKYADL